MRILLVVVFSGQVFGFVCLRWRFVGASWFGSDIVGVSGVFVGLGRFVRSLGFHISIPVLSFSHFLGVLISCPGD